VLQGRPNEGISTITGEAVPRHRRPSEGLSGRRLHGISEQSFDGSTDGTAQWLARLGEPRLRSLQRNHTTSIAATRNAAVRSAQGAWIAFLDSDERRHSAKLARQLARLRDRPDARWCYTKYQLISPDRVEVPQPHGSPWRRFEGSFADRILTTEAAVLIPTLVLPADLARRLPFDERLPLAEDYDLALRLAAAAPGCVVDEVLVDVRLHAGRTTALAGPFDGYFGKILACRKAARTLTDRRSRAIARRCLRSHLAEFLRRALRYCAIGQIARVTLALMRA
jgi:glycosyltransferase involved in cell wall biosynthesis